MHSSKSEPQRTKTRSPSLSHFKCGEGPIAHVEHQARARPPNDQRETKRVQVLRHSARQLRLGRYARTSKIADPVKPTDRLFIVAIVQNPEGVKQVKIHWQSAPQCKPLGDIGCKVGPGLTVPSTYSSAAQPGAQAQRRASEDPPAGRADQGSGDEADLIFERLRPALRWRAGAQQSGRGA